MPAFPYARFCSTTNFAATPTRIEPLGVAADHFSGPPASLTPVGWMAMPTKDEMAALLEVARVT